MSSAIDSLDGFIGRAERDRKYAPNTAAGMRAALNLFAAAMNEEEKESLDVMGDRLDQIYNEVFRRKTNKMSSDSLRTYYNRVKRVLSDHNNYNHDPDKYNKWSPQRRSHASKANKTSKKTNKTADSKIGVQREASAPAISPGGTNDRFEITFNTGQRALLILPASRSVADVEKLKKLIDFLEATTDINGDNLGEKKRPSSV